MAAISRAASRMRRFFMIFYLPDSYASLKIFYRYRRQLLQKARRTFAAKTTAIHPIRRISLPNCSHFLNIFWIFFFSFAPYFPFSGVNCDESVNALDVSPIAAGIGPLRVEQNIPSKGKEKVDSENRMVRADPARITCWKGAWFHWHTHHFLVLPVSAGAPQGIPPDILPHYIVRSFQI